MWDLVCGEDDVVILEEALREEVAEGVVFLVEGEDGGIGNACCVVELVDEGIKSVRAAYEFLLCTRLWTGRRRAGRARICFPRGQLCTKYNGRPSGRRAIHDSGRGQ
jgi:hypothetical protein